MNRFSKHPKTVVILARLWISFEKPALKLSWCIYCSCFEALRCSGDDKRVSCQHTCSPQHTCEPGPPSCFDWLRWGPLWSPVLSLLSRVPTRTLGFFILTHRSRTATRSSGGWGRRWWPRSLWCDWCCWSPRRTSASSRTKNISSPPDRHTAIKSQVGLFLNTYCLDI